MRPWAELLVCYDASMMLCHIYMGPWAELLGLKASNIHIVTIVIQFGCLRTVAVGVMMLVTTGVMMLVTTGVMMLVMTATPLSMVEDNFRQRITMPPQGHRATEPGRPERHKCFSAARVDTQAHL